ncbi:MAG: hypothetical protein ACI85Q_001661 [Salibacteraceae bacterium]|jgi:hypothetical protein
MEVTIEDITLKMKIYEGVLMRLCEYLGVNVYDQTLDSRINSKAVLNIRFVRFLEENKDFFKRYHDDYYKSKTPEQIAFTINRKLQVVDHYLKKEFPECYAKGKFNMQAAKRLKYVSSFEIDFELGSQQRINMNSLGVTAWHLGLKQQMTIDRLNLSVRR